MANWSQDKSRGRITSALAELDSVEIVHLTREMDLATAPLPLKKAYLVDGVHLYIDIVNADTLLADSGNESVASHAKFLRYLNVLQRVVHTSVLSSTNLLKVDAQNHRLHLLAFKPYDEETDRIAVAVASAAIIAEVLSRADELHAELPDAVVRVGIESGVALAVRNGTRGDRELLFLGDPANHAAKLVAAGAGGIYLGRRARSVLGLETSNPVATPLSADEISKMGKIAALSIDADQVLDAWREELAGSPLSNFEFSRPTPPLSGLDLDALTPGNSRHIDAIVMMADLDGFTNYVSNAIALGNGAEAIRALHVIRKELRDVLVDFGGKKVRYIGDCVQGVLAEGVSSTQPTTSVENATWCAAAMRDAMNIIKELVPGCASLGLGIGLAYGATSLTRLGVQGSRSRCIAGRSVLGAQLAQECCTGTETSIASSALAHAPDAFQRVFGDAGKCADLTSRRLESLLTVYSPATAPKEDGVVLERSHSR